MKSIYIADNIHISIKFLAALKKKSLSKLVEELLTKGVKKQLSDLPIEVLQKLAVAGGSFDFLNSPEEDLYSAEDGQGID